MERIMTYLEYVKYVCLKVVRTVLIYFTVHKKSRNSKITVQAVFVACFELFCTLVMLALKNRCSTEYRARIVFKISKPVK